MLMSEGHAELELGPPLARAVQESWPRRHGQGRAGPYGMGQLVGWTTQLLPRLRSTPTLAPSMSWSTWRARPAEEKPQGLYDLGQQQDTPEESW